MSSPSAADRRAALLLLLLAGAGTVVRLVAGRGTAPGGVAYRFADSTPPDSVAALARLLARPLEPGDSVDVDRAGTAELTRLPRIGPALAARVVAEREAGGPFGSLEALDRRVAGVGPTTVDAIRPWARFSGGPAVGVRAVAGVARVAVNQATQEELEALPGIGPHLARAIIEERRRGGPFRSAADLTRVPGIGPVIVSRLTTRIRIP